MTNPKRRLKKVDVSFISLVAKGANQKTIIYKSAEASDNPLYSKTISIKKYDEEKGILYGLVYSPDEVDSQGDIASADVIETMAHDFLAKGATHQVDEHHNYIPAGHAIVESWITRTNDAVFPSDPSGSWAVAIKIENEETKAKIKNGEITGLSLAGDADVEVLEKSDKTFLQKFEELRQNIIDTVKKVFNKDILQKDFNDEVLERTFRDYTWALECAINDILSDDTVVDKKSAILTSIDQYRTAINKIEIPNTKQSNNKNNEVDMTQDEVKKTISDAVQPLADKITAIEKLHNEIIEKLEKEHKDLTERVEKVEKATPGSKVVKNTGGDTDKKTDRIFL